MSRSRQSSNDDSAKNCREGVSRNARFATPLLQGIVALLAVVACQSWKDPILWGRKKSESQGDFRLFPFMQGLGFEVSLRIRS